MNQALFLHYMLFLCGGGGNTLATALEFLGDEWRGLSLDFMTDTYAMRQSTEAELLLGAGPVTGDTGLGVDFTADSYAIGI